MSIIKTKRARPRSFRKNFHEMPSPTGAKTLALLDLLAKHPLGVTAAEAARLSGVTGNLAFRILKTFVAMGYATQREDSKAYLLSNRLLDLSRPHVGDRSLVLYAIESLRQLRDDTGETVQLVIESSGHAFVVEQLQGTHALQVCGRVGMRISMHSCAPGKAILAAWNKDCLAQWFSKRVLKSFTSTTMTSRLDLNRALADTKINGYAVDRAEGIEGIHCVAAVIRDQYATPLAAITVMAPMTRLPEQLFASYGEKCKKAASSIEYRLRL